MFQSIEEIETGKLTYFRMQSMRWIGHDLVLELEGPSVEGQREGMRLRFEFAMDLRIQLDFGRCIGGPEIYDSTFSRLTNGWSVALEFLGGPDGTLSLECSRATIES